MWCVCACLYYSVFEIPVLYVCGFRGGGDVVSLIVVAVARYDLSICNLGVGR